MSRQATGFKKRQLLNSQTFRPDRSAQCKGIAVCAYSLKNIRTVQYLLYLMVCRTKTSFLCLLDKLTQMTHPVCREDQLAKRPLFNLPFGNTVPCTIFGVYRVNALVGACACILWSVLIKNTRGQIWCRLFVGMLPIHNAVLRFDTLCPHPNIRDESNTNSEVQYLSIGSILSLKYANLAVCP